MNILDPEKHARLIEEIDDIARMAGIPKRYIENSATDICSKEELGWLKGIRTHHESGQFGLCFEGGDYAPTMMAMCGALTRNFILAQMMTLNNLLDSLRVNDPVQATVLFVPSFHRNAAKGAVTPFQVNLLWNLLEERMLSERQTVIGVQSIAQMKIDYGSHFADLVTNHYRKLGC